MVLAGRGEGLIYGEGVGRCFGGGSGGCRHHILYSL